MKAKCTAWRWYNIRVKSMKMEERGLGRRFTRGYKLGGEWGSGKAAGDMESIKAQLRMKTLHNIILHCRQPFSYSRESGHRAYCTGGAACATSAAACKLHNYVERTFFLSTKKETLFINGHLRFRKQSWHFFFLISKYDLQTLRMTRQE